MIDPTEDTRRDMLPSMGAQAETAVANDEPTWTTEQLKRDFEVLGFAAPFVVVQRRSDGIKGSLLFNHGPERLYFGWQPDQSEHPFD